MRTTVSFQMPCYKRYDCTSTYLCTFLCSCSSILCENSNCMLRIIKKGGVIYKKIGTLLVSSQFYRFSFSCAAGDWHQLCMRNVELWNSDVHPHYFTNIAARNAAKQHMTKYHPQKSLSNSARSVVKHLPPSSYKILFFTVT